MNDNEIKSVVMNEELGILPLTYAINQVYYGEIIIENKTIQIIYSYLFGDIAIDNYKQNDTISSIQIEIQNHLSLNHNIKHNKFNKNNGNIANLREIPPISSKDINPSLTVSVCFSINYLLLRLNFETVGVFVNLGYI